MRDTQPASKLAQLSSDERAQTSIDLLLAVTIFFSATVLLTVTSPFLFFPDTLAATDETQKADTIANELMNSELSDAGAAGLSHTHVDEFIEDGDPNDVVSAGQENDVIVRLTVEDTDNAPEAFDTSRDSVDEVDGDYVAERGTEPDSVSSTIERTTTLDGVTVFVEVEVGFEA